MSGNGKIHPFGAVKPSLPEIPIVGQPFTLKNWFLQLLVTCNCTSRPEPLLLIGQVGATSQPCPHCSRQFVLQGMTGTPTGGLHLNIGATVPTPGPEGAQ